MNARQLPWNTKRRESAWGAVGEHDLQLAEHQIPVLVSGMPVPHDALGCQIKHLAQRVVVGKRRLVFRDLTELSVQSFDNIRRIYDFPNLDGVFEKRDSKLPNFLSNSFRRRDIVCARDP